MKKCLLFIVFLFILQSAYSQYEDYDAEKNNFFEISFRVIWPEVSDPQRLVHVNFSAGIHYPVIPRFLNPGIALDLGVGADWVGLFSLESYDEDRRDDDYQLGLNFGIRIYNLINLGIVSINTFAGYNFIFGQLDRRASESIHNPIVGVSFMILGIGAEYAYYIPTKYSNNIPFHHISIIYRTIF